MIVFKRLTYKNLFSTGSIPTVVDFGRHASTLITGKNGCGKSTLTDAICYVLFNRPYRNINKPQLINSINKKELLVEIEFSIGSQNFVVRRGMKPNIFEIIKDGKSLEHDAAVKDFQEYLEQKILQLNFRSFTQLVVIGSANYTPFMELSAAHRREVIEDLLDIRVFTSMNQLLKERIQSNKEQIKTTDDLLTLTNERLNIYIHQQVDVEKDIAARIDAIKVDIATNEEEIKEVQDKIAGLKEYISQQEERLEDVDKWATRQTKLENFEHRMKEKMRGAKKAIDFYSNNDVCPTCTQQIGESFKATEILKKQSVEQEVSDGLEKLNVELAKVHEALEELTQIQSDVQSAHRKVAAFNAHIAAITSNNTKLNSELQKVAATAPQKNQAAQIKELKKTIVSTNKTKSELLYDKQVLDLASDLLRDKGIKARIIKQYVPLINKIINKYLTEMGFMVHFELDETFSETIKSRHRDDFSYASFSEGEKARINFGVMLTWRTIAKLKNTMNTNLLILDETFDGSIDIDAAESFVKLLRDECGDSNVFVISHRVELTDVLHGHIMFEKVKGFSRIAQGPQ